jgi:dihydropteroate synthase
MGIINLTPDSFSGDGLYQGLSPSQLKGDYLKGTVPELAEKMVKDGADIIDVGGESSRPGARPVALKEELKRTIPVIKILARKIKSPISIDTYKPEVAKQALDNGAVLVNDIRGLSNAEMRKVVARSNAGAVIMHMKGTPHTMQKNPVYRSVVCEVMGYLKQAIERAKDCGISEDKIIVDPGIGFGKTAEDNLELLKRLNEFKVLGRPILVGPSRKSFIGAVLKAAPPDRVYGTVSACVLAVKNGASIVRVHDCLEVKQAFKVMEAIDKA